MPLNIPADLPTTSRRNRALYEHINQLADAIRSGQSVISNNMRTSQTAIGTIHEALDGVATVAESVSLKRFVITEIVSVTSNYFKAREYLDDGTGADPDKPETFIAVPFYLRPTNFDNVTVSGARFLALSGSTIRQSLAGVVNGFVPMSVFPGYNIGQDVYAFQPIGKTDVVVAAGIIPGTTSAHRLEWMDANVDGRHLETGLVALDVCKIEGGVTVQRKVLVRGGAIYNPV